MSSFNLEHEWTCELYRIKGFLCAVEQHFYEPLSQRVDIQEYALKLSTNAKNLFLVEESGADVAHVAFYENKKENSIFISSIATKTTHRNNGLGGYILEVIKTYAKENNYKEIELEVDARANKLISFYKKNSFVELKRYENTLRLNYLIN